MRKIFLTICFFFSITQLLSQKYTICGLVCDSVSGEKLIGVSIFEKSLKFGTISNNFGFYSLTFGNDTVEIVCKYIGYISYTKKIILNENCELNILLQPADNTLKEIVVSGDNVDKSFSYVMLSPKQISKMPTLGGEKDVLKSFQFLPGIMQGSEGKSGLFVRGGSDDQNLILLDDVPLYYSEHLGGFLSIFNDDALKNIKLIKGNFPAKYGGRLSSVLDVRTKDGNMSKTNISGSVGIISTKIEIDGPIIKNKLSYMISARRMMLDVLVLPFAKLLTNNYLMGYSFYDLNTKINYKFNNRNNFYLSFYNGKDNVKINSGLNNNSLISENKSEQKWGNYTSSFRWNHTYGSKLFSNLTFSLCRFRYNSFEETFFKSDNITILNQNSFNSGIYDLNLNLDYEYYCSKIVSINFGSNSSYHTFNPSIIRYFQQVNSTVKTDTTYSNSQFNSIENAFYTDADIKISDFISTTIGIRTNYYRIDSSNFLSFEPRTNIKANISKQISLNISFSYVEQNIHKLSFSGMGVYSDLWVPATKIALPEKAWQLSTGLNFKLFENIYDFRLEGYYKKLYNLIDFGYGTFWNNAANWEQNSVKNGKGICFGIEFLLSKNDGKLTGWISYTYSKAKRQFANINSGKYFDYDFDRPHDFKITGIYNFNEKIFLSANWIYQTGQPINLPIGSLPYIVYSEILLNDNLLIDENFDGSFFFEKNSIRMRSYHRLDIALNWTKIKKLGTRTWSFSIYNVYNRQNAYNYFFEYQYDVSQEKYIRKLFQRTLFPIIPSVSYSFKF